MYVYEFTNKSNLKESIKCKKVKDCCVKLVTSYDNKERFSWLEFWITKSLAYSFQTKNKDWQCKFSTTYALHNNFQEIK